MLGERGGCRDDDKAIKPVDRQDGKKKPPHQGNGQAMMIS
jgi:hypothetical protein